MINNEIFLKATGLPIKVTLEPYFNEYLDILEKDFQAKTKYNEFIKLNNEIKSFDEIYYTTRNNIIKHILEKKEYELFNKLDLEKYKSNIKEGNLYIMPNNNKIFISFDIVKANFQALKYIDKEIVDNTLTYDEFISQFTDIDFIKKSKYIRQYIFGNLNPKRIIHIEKFLINKVIELSTFESLLHKWEIAVMNKDEIILSLKDGFNFNYESDYKMIQDVITEMMTLNNIELRGDIFKLEAKTFKTQFDKLYYIYLKKSLLTNQIDYKNIPSIFFIQIYKIINNIPVTENDLLFINENELCRTLKPLTLIK